LLESMDRFTLEHVDPTGRRREEPGSGAFRQAAAGGTD
jgi:hypothetical protein